VKIEGKHRSRVAVYGPDEESPGERIIPWTWRKELGWMRDEHVAFLRARGLPDKPWVWFTRANPGKWQATDKPWWRAKRPRTKDRCYALDKYVRELGFTRDSPEELAARIIWKIAQLEQSSGDRALSRALELGALAMLYRVYAQETASSSRGGRGKAATKEELERLDKEIRALLKRRPRLSNRAVAGTLADQGYGERETIRKQVAEIRRTIALEKKSGK
jgi:hypothetical protein